MRYITYQFGRLNLIANFTDKKEFLLKAFQNELVMSVNKHEWAFFNITVIKSEFGEFVHGYLVKYRPEFPKEIANRKTHRLQNETDQDVVIAKARFFLHIKSGLISYHASSKIPRETFCLQFCKLIIEAHNAFFVDAEIETIQEREKVFESMKELKRITKIKLRLHPSNPSYSHIWASYDMRIKALGASKSLEEYEAEPKFGNLKIAQDQDIVSKITMADDGYGKAEITGQTDNDETRKITTGDFPITEQAPDGKHSASQVLDYLQQKFSIIMDRFVR